MKDLKNLLKETEELHNLDHIKWAVVKHPYGNFILKPDHYLGKDSLEKFKEFLNIQYDNGFGGQEVFGLIVFYDGSWLERHEYDGSEWWELKSEPQYNPKYAEVIGKKNLTFDYSVFDDKLGVYDEYFDYDEEYNWELTDTDEYAVFEMPKKII